MKLIVTKENSRMRIDKFLTQEPLSYTPTPAEYSSHSLAKQASSWVWGCTRGEIARSITAGNVLVGGKKIKPSYILKENDEITINISEKKLGLAANKNIKLKILYEDKNIIVIDKPAGLAVHPVKSENNTLVNFLLHEFPEIKNVRDSSTSSEQVNLRPGIVHRLDKDTSGAMVVARNQKTFDELKKLFQTRKIQKEYLALVFGKLKNKKGVIEKALARSKDYKKQIIASVKTKTKIRPAVTEYAVIKKYGNYSLIKACPKTGRTHQIRIHLASLGNPVVGDKKYASKLFKNIKQSERQLLHAKHLEFELFGKKYAFTSPLPADFQNFLAGLTNKP